jgi:ubiquinone/menaquinone biosynthesis C-methylase UbiE
LPQDRASFEYEHFTALWGSYDSGTFDPQGVKIDGQLFADYFHDHAPKIVLDIGCGSGLSTNVFSEIGSDRVLMDLTIEALQLAIRNCRTKASRSLDFVRGDFLHLPFQDQTFDLVVTQDILKYFHPRTAFPELQRVSKDDASLTSSLPYLFSWRWFKRFIMWKAANAVKPRRETVHYFTKRSAHQSMERSGFEIKKWILIRGKSWLFVFASKK